MLLGTLLAFSCSDDDNLPFDGSDNSITSFSLTALDGVRYSGEITGDKIVVTAPLNVSLSGAKVNFSLCEQASISPAPEEVTDWDTEQTFVVTAYNQETKKYTYNVMRTDVPSEGEVRLVTQADVDALAASGVTIIEGDLIIGENSLKEGADTIKDLSALSGLIEVKQNIIVNNSFGGTSLKGLENIRSAAGIYFGNTSSSLNCPNEFDVELSALKNLGQLVVNSAKVKSLHLPSLREIGWLYLCAAKLANVNFSSLENCVTNFTMNATNTVLESMAFPVLESVGGVVTLQDYKGVKELSFPKLKMINGTLTVSSLSALRALEFPELKNVVGNISVSGVEALTSFGMPKLEQVRELKINMNFWSPQVAFQSLDLQSLKSVEGNFTFDGNALNEMSTLELPALERVAGKFLWQYFHGEKVSIPNLSDCANMDLFYFDKVKELDITSVENLQNLHLLGYNELINIKTRSSIGNLTLNAGNKEMPPFPFKNLQEITGTFQLNNFNSNSTYVISGIKKINNISSMGGCQFQDLSYSDLEEVGTATFQMYQLNYLRLPKLKTVRENFTFGSIKELKILELPALEKVGGKFTLSGMSWMPSDFSQMVFPVLAEVGSVAISDLKDLSDFSALKNVVGTLDASQWKVSGCAYNPTLDDMKAGKYIPEN